MLSPFDPPGGSGRRGEAWRPSSYVEGWIFKPLVRGYCRLRASLNANLDTQKHKSITYIVSDVCHGCYSAITHTIHTSARTTDDAEPKVGVLGVPGQVAGSRPDPATAGFTNVASTSREEGSVLGGCDRPPSSETGKRQLGDRLEADALSARDWWSAAN